MPFGADRIRMQLTASQVKVGDKLDRLDGTHVVVSVNHVDDPSYPGAYRVQTTTDKGGLLDLDPSDSLSITERG